MFYLSLQKAKESLKYYKNCKCSQISGIECEEVKKEFAELLKWLENNTNKVNNEQTIFSDLRM